MTGCAPPRNGLITLEERDPIAFFEFRVLGLASPHGNWGDQHRQSAETENASPIKKVDVFTGQING